VGTLDIAEMFARLGADLATAGPRFQVERVPLAALDIIDPSQDGEEVTLPFGDEALQISVDGTPDIWIVATGTGEPKRELCDLIGQAQEVVMEQSGEPWPLCPLHYHSLVAVPTVSGVAWCCPEAGSVCSQFGNLS
jgi:hypothetical protein